MWVMEVGQEVMAADNKTKHGIGLKVEQVAEQVVMPVVVATPQNGITPPPVVVEVAEEVAANIGTGLAAVVMLSEQDQVVVVELE